MFPCSAQSKRRTDEPGRWNTSGAVTAHVEHVTAAYSVDTTLMAYHKIGPLALMDYSGRSSKQVHRRAALPLPSHAFKYEVVSIWLGISPMFTSKRSCTFFNTSASSSVDAKVRASPFVPKRPALPTRCK